MQTPAKSAVVSLREKAAKHAEQARKIQVRIREMENDQFVKIGRTVVELHKKDWAGFDVAEFKKQVASTVAL